MKQLLIILFLSYFNCVFSQSQTFDIDYVIYQKDGIKNVYHEDSWVRITNLTRGEYLFEFYEYTNRKKIVLSLEKKEEDHLFFANILDMNWLTIKNDFIRLSIHNEGARTYYYKE